MKFSTAWMTLALLIAGPAASQVYKCPDPVNNRTVYSDKPCSGEGVQIERKRSQAEIEYDRQKAAAEYQKFQASQQREPVRQQTTNNNLSRQPPSSSQGSQSRLDGTYECRIARRELELAGSIKTGTDESRKAAIEATRMKAASACGQKYIAPPREPTHRDLVLVGELPDPIHPCQVGGSCLGTVSEMRYTRTSEKHFWREDGKSCSGSDTSVICH